MINDNAEKCRGCTIKHLSEAFSLLKEGKDLDKLDIAYICGNLGHAANHFVHFSPEIAAKIRELRLDSINEDLTLALDKITLQTRLEKLILEIGDWKEPEPVKIVQPAVKSDPPAPKRGCRCSQKH